MRVYSDEVKLYRDVLDNYFAEDVEFSSEFFEDIDVSGLSGLNLLRIYADWYRIANGDYVLCLRRDSYSEESRDGDVYISGHVCGFEEAVSDVPVTDSLLDFLSSLEDDPDFVFVRADEYAEAGDDIEGMLTHGFLY